MQEMGYSNANAHVHPLGIHSTISTGKSVNQRIQPGDTLQDVRCYLLEEWDNITAEQIGRLVASMRRRCAALIQSQGGQTRY